MAAPSAGPNSVPPATKNHHDHEFAGTRPVQHVGADKLCEIRHQRSGEPGPHPGDDERDELVLIGGDANRREATLILANAAENEAEARPDEPPEDREIQTRDRQADEVERRVVAPCSG